MSELPASWVQCAIGDTAKIVGGATPNSNDPTNFTEEGGISWLTPADLSGYSEMYISRGRRNLTEKGYQSCSAKLMPLGTVLFSSRAPIGYVVIARNAMCTNQGFKSFVPYRGVSSKYLYYYLKFAKKEIEELGTGSTFQEISGKKAERIPLILAPENEQERIAEKLDQIFAELDSIKSRLDKLPVILKKFRMSILDQAIKGSNDSSKTSALWNIKKLGEIIEVIESGKNIRCTERPPKEGECGIIKISAVTWGYFNEEESKTLDKRALFLENRKIQKGNFLISRANTLELVGAPVIVKRITKELMLSDKVLRLVMPEDKKKWVMYVLKSNYGRKQIESRASGNQQSMRNISQKSLAEIPIPFPDQKIISSIVEHIEIFMALSDDIEKKYKQAVEQVHKIKESILNKAFHGEFLPQNPDDEPASTLLRNITMEKKLQTHNLKLNLAVDDIKTRDTRNKSKRKHMTKKLQDVLSENQEWLPAQDMFELCGIGSSSQTEDIERLYAELRSLDKLKKLEIDPVYDSDGKKQYDRLKLKTVG